MFNKSPKNGPLDCFQYFAVKNCCGENSRIYFFGQIWEFLCKLNSLAASPRGLFKNLIDIANSVYLQKKKLSPIYSHALCESAF